MNYLYCLYIQFLSKHGIPQLFGDITFYIIPFLVIFIALTFVVLILVLAERKLLAYFTQRKGPNRVGFWGVLQTLADAIKLLCKENITPGRVDKFLFTLAPVLIFIPVPVVIGLIPFSSEFTLMNFQTNLLIYMVFATLPVLSIFIAGLASNNKYSLLGAMRNVSQIVAYELPIAFSILAVAVLASSLNLTQIMLSQLGTSGFLKWFVFPGFISFIVMFIGVIAELNRCPFDLPEAESELTCGYNTEYSGMRFAMFYLSEYAMLFANSLLLAVLFFGGYLSPFGQYLSTTFFDGQLGNILLYFEQVFWLLLKTCMIIFVIIWIRATLPRLASFDLLKYSWTVLLPLSIINFLLILVIKFIIGGAYV